MKILIADDHPVVRRGLRQIMTDEIESVEVGEAGDGREVLEQLKRTDWDVVLLDVSMPGASGLEVLRILKEDHPSLPVLVLSMHPEDQYAVRAFRAGASGYLTKGSATEELVNAVRKVTSGGRYVSPTLAESLAQHLYAEAERSGHAGLSDREHQVLLLIGSGKTVGEIAQEMSLSVKTISTYRTRLLEKMGMRNNAELMQYAIRQGLVT